MKESLAEVAAHFNRAGFAFYLTGGTALALYQGREPVDLDGWTNADLLFVAARFDDVDIPTNSNYSALINLDGLTLRLVCSPLTSSRDGGKVAFPDLRRLTAERIFSIDALLYDPALGKYLDPQGCLSDIRSHLLRLLGPLNGVPAQRIDAFFRSVLLECADHYRSEAGLESQLLGKLPEPSRETLPDYRHGLGSVLTCRDPFAGLSRLLETGVLVKLIPELGALKGCPQDKDFHPEGDVMTHTLECFRRLHRPPLPLALGLLFHDIGKPATLTVDRHIHFPNHSSVGAVMTGRILRRLGFPRPVIEEVKFYIRYHLLWRVIRGLSDQDLAAFAGRVEFPQLLRLYLADIQASTGDLTSYREAVRKTKPYVKK